MLLSGARRVPTRRELLVLLVPVLVLSALFLSASPTFAALRGSRRRAAWARPRYFPPPGGLRAWIADEDVRYEGVVAARWDMIKAAGPDPASVESFPRTGHTHTLWDFFIPAFRCPHSTERVGALADGGKWVCGMELLEAKPSCVVYSFGVNTDSSFEAELLSRAPGCKVWGYDFSVTSWGPEITSDPSLRSRAHFRAWGLGGKDDHGPTAWPPMYTLQSLMAINGHTFIDVLKIDIELSEFDALAGMLRDNVRTRGGAPLPFGQLQLEIHAWAPYDGFEFFLGWWEALEHAGLRPFWFEPNLIYVHRFAKRPDAVEYSFINIRGGHALVAD